uniref:Oxysterol-binding protein n=1 Tax=Oncorhynchus mykiss TaxID=8022 RepID=A0A8C7UKY8_ONCMY
MSGLEKTPPTLNKPTHSRSSSTASSHWEVMDDLQVEMMSGDNSQDLTIPGICEGYLLKRRKWPLKGWHKRYFVLETGILRYSKTQQDITRGKLHGSLDVGLAVMSINKKSNRIDLDAGDVLYHMKANSHDLFYIWVAKLSAHRMFKKNEAAQVHNGFFQALSQGTSVPGLAQRNGMQDVVSPLALYRSESKHTWTHTCSVRSLLLMLNVIFFIFPSLSVHASLKSVHDALAQERQRLQDTYHQSTTLAEVRVYPFMETGLVYEMYLFVCGCFSSPTSPSSWLSFSWCFISRRTPSVTDSAAEYFDASDGVLNGSFSESESGLSEGTTTSATREYRASISKTPNCVVPKNTGRRTTLAAHCPDNAQVGLMQILYNNIGKDLSRVSMPAALNEPINLMQRLCEELEYSELLDTANNTQDPYQRMVYVGAFAISGYATAHYRNRYKPFNPLLGETYECLREDKGFRYISEQVCHHPPISACHADSDNFSFWQDQRWKNKFWGKSLEIMPTGMVNVTLPRFGDHYEWNKVVTCIHNVLSQQRYLEHYGEVIIRNLNGNACTCKITFVKSRYWGSDTNKNEVQGTVLDQTGSVIHRFGGLWHEGIFCDTLPTPQCIWKPNSQPKDYYLYYGFSSFTLELNELTPGLKPLLPPTDSRLRPDQRMLEDGRVDDCDKFKEEVEDMQRERRKQLAKKGQEHTPRFFKKAMDSSGRDVWLTNGTYWKVRENPGFANTKNLELW